MTNLNVELIESNMSFSVSKNFGEFEWAGTNLRTVFSQTSNLFNLKFFMMLKDIMKFHSQAIEVSNYNDKLKFENNGNDSDERFVKMSVKEFLHANNYSEAFYEDYLLPMTASIWSTPAGALKDFPLLTLVKFMRNHQLLQIGNRPKWKTVNNGSQSYIDAILKTIRNVKINLSTSVYSIKRRKVIGEPVVLLKTKKEVLEFDHVIFAVHTDQALKILKEENDCSELEFEILNSIQYIKNKCTLHRDPRLMPKRKNCWASWNYLTERVSSGKKSDTSLCLTYWMNKLQKFIDKETYGDVFVTLNPLTQPKSELILGEWEYSHPLYNEKTVEAQEKLNSIQNNNFASFTGAWTNYGFHEDGLTSGLLAAVSLGAECPFEIALNGGYPTNRKVYPVPDWSRISFDTKIKEQGNAVSSFRINIHFNFKSYHGSTKNIQNREFHLQKSIVELEKPKAHLISMKKSRKPLQRDK
ncbi:hypothetical protein HK099_004560 [Clydaea vesicula]|uniref:Amine oxidase domain-containing protein n=1 Tax=Clydaea vesicula TaxID=447962 RepID=A0AAD5U0B8_9FUNG|nr:hypothetical protein HK099_004560 [Clydaea vesicula]